MWNKQPKYRSQPRGLRPCTVLLQKVIPGRGQNKTVRIVAWSGTGKTNHEPSTHPAKAAIATRPQERLFHTNHFRPDAPGGLVYTTENGCFRQDLRLDPAVTSRSSTTNATTKSQAGRPTWRTSRSTKRKEHNGKGTSSSTSYKTIQTKNARTPPAVSPTEVDPLAGRPALSPRSSLLILDQRPQREPILPAWARL